MNVRNPLLPLLLVVVLEHVFTTLEAYKSVRPYKYHFRGSYQRPKWHPGPRPPWRYPPRKRAPPRYYPRHRPTYHRYPPRYEYAADYATDEQPYTIEIELPKRRGTTGRYSDDNYNKRGFNKGEVYDELEYDEYGNDEYEEQDRAIRTGKKKVRIKVIKGPRPKLNIRISRVDDDNVTESALGALERPQITTNLAELEQKLIAEWVPANPKPSFPIHLRGA